MLLEKLEERRRRKERRPIYDQLNPYTGIISAVSAVILAIATGYGAYITTRQADIAERALNLSNRNTEIGNLLTSLDKTCLAFSNFREVFFGSIGFYFKRDFNFDAPNRPAPGEKHHLYFNDVAQYPDPTRTEVLAIASKTLEAATDALTRYRVVGLYLTDKEAAEAHSEKVQFAFSELVDVADAAVKQDVSSRDLIGNLIIASAICRLLPDQLTAWFRSSAQNPLGYVLIESDVKFEWTETPRNFTLFRSSYGVSLEDRTELEGSPMKEIVNPQSRY